MMILTKKANHARVASLVVLALLSLDTTDLMLCQSLDGHVAVETRGSSCCIPQQSCETLAIGGGAGTNSEPTGSCLLMDFRRLEVSFQFDASESNCDDISLVHAVLGNHVQTAPAIDLPAAAASFVEPVRRATREMRPGSLLREHPQLSLLRSTLLLI
jgi:hypothetical protein